MKKVKKAIGKHGEGVINLASSAVKTVISAPLSDREKTTLHHLQGRERPIETSASNPDKDALLKQQQVVIIHQVFAAVGAANPPSFEEVMGAQDEYPANG